MKTAVITGATSGIGFAVARALAGEGWRVLGVGRDAARGALARENILTQCPDGDVRFFTADLAQQEEVRRVARELNDCLREIGGGALDALILNAGGVRSYYATTAEGYEQQFALNHLSGFLLTYLLLPALRRGEGKVLLTGSESHRHTRIHWEDPMYRRRRYNCLGAYKQAKLCNMLFAREFNRRCEGSGLRAWVIDPGLVNTDIGQKGTGGLVHLVWSLRRRGGVSPEHAANAFVHVCQNAPPGLYSRQTTCLPYDRHVDSAGDAARLFELSERLCGIHYKEVPPV